MIHNLDTMFDPIRKKPRSKIARGYRQRTHTDLYQQVVGFTCIKCKQIISSDPLLSGVNNRNHCPYCLTSKHVDLYQAGDRLNACKSQMQSIGLAWKHSRNKYGSGLGELMIIHRCDGCGGLSLNRIAADDDPDRILQLFEATLQMKHDQLKQLNGSGIHPLLIDHYWELMACVFGKK